MRDFHTWSVKYSLNVNRILVESELVTIINVLIVGKFPGKGFWYADIYKDSKFKEFIFPYIIIAKTTQNITMKLLIMVGI